LWALSRLGRPLTFLSTRSWVLARSATRPTVLRPQGLKKTKASPSGIEPGAAAIRIGYPQPTVHGLVIDARQRSFRTVVKTIPELDHFSPMAKAPTAPGCSTMLALNCSMAAVQQSPSGRWMRTKTMRTGSVAAAQDCCCCSTTGPGAAAQGCCCCSTMGPGAAAQGCCCCSTMGPGAAARGCCCCSTMEPGPAARGCCCYYSTLGPVPAAQGCCCSTMERAGRHCTRRTKGRSAPRCLKTKTREPADPHYSKRTMAPARRYSKTEPADPHCSRRTMAPALHCSKTEPADSRCSRRTMAPARHCSKTEPADPHCSRRTMAPARHCSKTEPAVAAPGYCCSTMESDYSMRRILRTW